MTLSTRKRFIRFGVVALFFLYLLSFSTSYNILALIRSGHVLCYTKVKSGFACDKDVKTIKSQISGRVQQLKRERDIRRMSATAVPVSVVENQIAATAVAIKASSAGSTNVAAATDRHYCGQEKDGHVDGLCIIIVALAFEQSC